MFIYEFKSTNCLITKIVISGLHLTVYTNKPNAAELNGMIKKFNLNSKVSADHPKHVFCHNSYIDFSARGDSIPHQHLKFNNISSIKEIPIQMKELLDFLTEVQQDSSMRKLEFDNLLHAANEERVSYGHAVFPKRIQDTFDNYDITSPYISSLECANFIASLNTYYSQDYNLQQNALVQHAEDFLGTHWDVIYMKNIIGCGEVENEQEQNVIDYYNMLLNLRSTLLKINLRQNDYNLYQEASSYIDGLRRNNNFDKLLPFSQDISDVENYLSNKANFLILSFILQATAIVTGLTIGAALLMVCVRNTDKSAYSYLTTALLCGIGIGTACLTKPLYASVKQTFFDYSKPKGHHETKVSEPNWIIIDAKNAKF